jgi:hypothetical protein
MSQGTGQVAQAQTSDRQRAIRRILQVIDKTGGGVTSIDVQNAALQAILDSDTFCSTAKNGILVDYDLQALRDLAARIAYDCNLKPTNREDRVACLFRVQSCGLPPHRLRRWQHEPVRVPFESERSTRMGGPVIPKDFQGPNELPFLEKAKLFRYRALWLILQDIDVSHSEPNDSNHQYSTWSMRQVALQILCQRCNLRYLTRKTLPGVYTGKSLYKVVSDAWEGLRAHDGIVLDSLWLEGSKSCRSEGLQEIRAAYDAFDSEGNLLLAQDHAAPAVPVHQHDQAGRGSASSLSSIDNIIVDSRPQSNNNPTESDPLVTAQNAEPRRRLKRKASVAENPPSTVSSLRVVRPRSPVVDLSPRDLDEAQAVQSPPSEASSLDIARSQVVCLTPRDLAEAQAAQPPDDHSTMPPDKPSRLSPKDVVEQLHGIRDLQITQVQWMTGYFKLPPSPSPVSVTPEPNQLLATLYARCWGDEWRRDGDLLLWQDKRSVFNDTMALLSSFLFENILTAAALQSDRLLTSENGAGTSARPIHPFIRNQLTSASSSETTTAAILALRADLLQTKLLAALHPFFSALAQLTRAMYSTPFNNNINPLLDPEFQQFETALSEIVTKTMALKSELDKFDLAPTFVWPQTGEPYDGERMQAAHAVDPGLAHTYTVAYTTFPGVLMPRAGGSLGFSAFKAFVVLQQVVARR